MTIVFLKFSDRANGHRSVRLPSRAVHIFQALSLDAYSPHMGIFSYCFPTKLCAGPYKFKTLFYNSVIPFCRLCNTVKLWTVKAKGLVKFVHHNKEVLLYWRSFPDIVLFLALCYFWGEKYNLFILHRVLCYIEVPLYSHAHTGNLDTHTKCCFEIITVLKNSTSKEKTRHCWSKIW